MGFLIISATVSLTDADLSDEERVVGNRATATTIDLGSRSTVNRGFVNILFQSIGLVSGGFDVRSLRLTDDGKTTFEYGIGFQQIGGSQTACRALDLTVNTRNGDELYKGKLSEINIRKKFGGGKATDLVLFLDYPGGANGLSCQFDLVIKTYREKQGSGGLRDEERLTNLVTLGS